MADDYGDEQPPQDYEDAPDENQEDNPEQNEYPDANEDKEPEPEPQRDPEPEPASYDSSNVPSNLDVSSAWKEICKDNNAINWYICGVTKKQALEFAQAGAGGLNELKGILSNSASELRFGLLRVNSNDKGGSVRAKFIYIRFVGSSVGVMKKAKITPNLGKIGDSFPVKHLTLDLSEELTGFTVESLAKEFLRVGGAHKPDSYEFGPGQVFDCRG